MSLKNQPRKSPKRAPKRSHDELVEDAKDKAIAAETPQGKYAKSLANDWIKLRELINDYADASIAESWKGGGDPEEIPVIEMELQLADLKLDTFIEQMKQRHDA